MVDCKIANQGIKGLVSVIMPTHNRCDLVKETIDSLLNQTYKTIELIIIDDHSTDNTKECIERYVEEYDFIHYYMSEGWGACAARNLGILKSQGEYIQFMDDDDIVHEDFIKQRIEALQKDGQVGFATCNMSYFQKNLENIVKYFRIDNIEHDIYNHLLRSALPAPLFLFRRSTIEAIGFWDENCLRFQDIRYYHRLFLRSINGVWLSDYLYYVRIHEQSISRRYDRKTIESVLRVYNSINIEWRAEHKQNLRLSRILFLQSTAFLIGNFSYDKCWILREFLNLAVSDLDGFIFFIRFLVQKLIFSKKAVDLY